MPVLLAPSRTRWSIWGVHAGGSTAGDGTLLPDLLCYDPTRPASFPDNGRAPTTTQPISS